MKKIFTLILISFSAFAQVNINASGGITVGGVNVGGINNGGGITVGGITTGGINISEYRSVNYNGDYQSEYEKAIFETRQLIRESENTNNRYGENLEVILHEYPSVETTCDLKIDIVNIKRGTLKDKSINLLFAARDENPEIQIKMELLNNIEVSDNTEVASRIFLLDMNSSNYDTNENLFQLDSIEYKSKLGCLVNSELVIKVLDYDFFLPSTKLLEKSFKLNEIEYEIELSERGEITKTLVDVKTSVEIILNVRK